MSDYGIIVLTRAKWKLIQSGLQQAARSPVYYESNPFLVQCFIMLQVFYFRAFLQSKVGRDTAFEYANTFVYHLAVFI